MTCASIGCEKPAKTRGYCDPHYRRRLHTGRYGDRDAAAVREHVLRLRELGWTFAAIAAAAGLSPWVPCKLASGTTGRVRRETEDALLALPLTPLGTHRGVSGVGSRRRVQALAWMGWPNHEVCRRIGCSPRTLPTELARGRLSVRLAQRIAAVYEELAMIPGPSPHAAGKARERGCVPPLGWDDESIDDPTAQPLHTVTDLGSRVHVDPVAVEEACAGYPRRPLTIAERGEAQRRLEQRGLSAKEIAARLRISDRTVVRKRSREAAA